MDRVATAELHAVVTENTGFFTLSSGNLIPYDYPLATQRLFYAGSGCPHSLW